MFKLNNKIAFTRDVITDVYNYYSKLAFCDAVRLLIKTNLLDNEDKSIILKATLAATESKNFLTKSYVIYLSNFILSENKMEKILQIKKQLIFEIGIMLLEHNIEKKILFKNENKMLFSLRLNKHINKKFDVIKKRDNLYFFYYFNNEVLKIEKNNEFDITKDIDLLEDDRNPFNNHSDHPDQEFVAYDLGGIPKEKWVLQFRNAYKIIKEKVPEIYEEIYYFLDAVVPHGYVYGKQLSSSYSKSPGILYLSYTNTDTEQAEAIIHEVHHTIYNIINWKYKLVNNDMSLKYYSAYRPDARHINGCFIGLHAFVAVQNFYRKLAETENKTKFIEKFFKLYLKNKIVISVLKKYADFTKEGKLLFQDIKTKYCSDTGFFEELKNKNTDIYNHVLQRINGHLEEAKKRNETLLY